MGSPETGGERARVFWPVLTIDEAGEQRVEIPKASSLHSDIFIFGSLILLKLVRVIVDQPGIKRSLIERSSLFFLIIDVF
jgi:hypothetical protein